MFRLVSFEALLLAAAFAAGLLLQRHRRHAQLQRWLWDAFFWTIAPAAAIYAYTTVEIDRTLVGSLLVVAISSWLVLGIAIAAARLVSHDDAERGALVLASGWGNTVALGYPIANYAYGARGPRAPGAVRAVLLRRTGHRDLDERRAHVQLGEAGPHERAESGAAHRG